ncbi:MAG: hypothetical protein ABIQ58_04810 [Candidatus Limnocylindrales bacterium]
MARAKRTARADARRRYRVEQGLPPDEMLEGDDIEGTSAVRSSAQPVVASGAPSVRLGIVNAFRQSFRPLDLRGDLAALPHIALRTKALWIPIALTVVSTATFYVTQGSDIVTKFMFAYFIQTPAIGGVFLAGFLAPRASWLLGVIVGLISAACYAFLILTVFSAVVAASPTPGLAQDVIFSGFVLSPIMGAIFASAAAWYRRFLALSNPNRGRGRGRGQPTAKRGTDGRSRAAAQKASARR